MFAGVLAVQVDLFKNMQHTSAFHMLSEGQVEGRILYLQNMDVSLNIMRRFIDLLFIKYCYCHQIKEVKMNVASSKYGGCDNEVRNLKGEDKLSQARRSVSFTQHSTVNTKKMRQ